MFTSLRWTTKPSSTASLRHAASEVDEKLNLTLVKHLARLALILQWEEDLLCTHLQQRDEEVLHLIAQAVEREQGAGELDQLKGSRGQPRPTNAAIEKHLHAQLGPAEHPS